MLSYLKKKRHFIITIPIILLIGVFMNFAKDPYTITIYDGENEYTESGKVEYYLVLKKNVKDSSKKFFLFYLNYQSHCVIEAPTAKKGIYHFESGAGNDDYCSALLQGRNYLAESTKIKGTIHIEKITESNCVGNYQIIFFSETGEKTAFAKGEFNTNHVRFE